MKKRIALVLLTVMMFMMGESAQAFFGFGKKKKSNEKVVVRFGWWGGNSRHEATLKAIEKFEAKYPNIDVKPEYAGWTGYNEKLITQMVGNSAPDLMQVNWNVLFDLGSDKFMDLKDSNIDLSNYPKAAIEKVTIDGKVVAVPLGMAAKIFFYQKNTYEKAGLSLPQSFDDLFKDAKVFKEKLGDQFYPMLLEDYTGFLMVLYYTEQVTGKPFIDNNSNKVAYTVDELTKGFDFYKKLVKEGVVPSIEQTQEGGVVSYDQNPKWINGQYAACYEWDSSAGKVQGSTTEGTEVVVGKTPTDFGKPSLLNKISMTFAINKKSKHKEEAETLLNFLITDPDGVKAMGVQRGIPLNKATAKILEDAGMLKGLQYTAHKEKLKSSGLGMYPFFESKELKEFYRNTMQELGASMVTSKEASEKIIDMVNKYIAEKSSK